MSASQNGPECQDISRSAGAGQLIFAETEESAAVADIAFRPTQAFGETPEGAEGTPPGVSGSILTKARDAQATMGYAFSLVGRSIRIPTGASSQQPSQKAIHACQMLTRRVTAGELRIVSKARLIRFPAGTSP